MNFGICEECSKTPEKSSNFNDLGYMGQIDQGRLVEERERDIQEERVRSAQERDQIAEEDAQTAAADRVPPEPGNDSNAYTIRFRGPDGQFIQINGGNSRRFRSSDKVKALVDFAQGEGFSPDDYILVTPTPPRCDLNNSTWSNTLADLGLTKRDVIIIERI